MLLERINSPEDLRSLTHAELDDLATEIREFIVDAVNACGSGHLGSNLGAVELTIALHRVFESPRDILLWDTGHQAYVHKILTGRRDSFTTLRQEGGLSGYPSRSESPHDWIENSHASTVLSYAHGLATAQQSEHGDGRRVVAVIGDGSMTGGMAYEGLNNLGHSGRDCIIVLNDNGRSYAPTVSRLGESLNKVRSNPTYVRETTRMERFLRRVPLVGRFLNRGFNATRTAAREFWTEPVTFFEQLGLFYSGPFDGHDVRELERAFRNASEIGGPQVVHVVTQKGRGYAPAENDSVKHLHDVGGVKPGSYTAAFTEALIKAGENHPELVAITAAMPDSTGLLPFAERFPDRMIDVGIAEQHAVTSAAGMAMGGLLPVFAVYSTFLTRAIDQVNLDVALHGQKVIFCLDRAGITGDDGASHHGVLDMVLLSKVPGMTVLAPSSYQELQAMLHDAVELADGPVAIRWPKTAARNVHADEVGVGFRARRWREGDDVCILAVGKMLEAALAAADELAAEGRSVTVWDARAVTPVDLDMIADAARHRLVLTVEDGYRDGGAGALFAEHVAAHVDEADVPMPSVSVLGVPTRFIAQAKPDAILAELGLDATGIAAEVRRRS
ncbi:1-deoxy-D-xylulose-5-phosphate synthase [Actinomarinicola tropica]|uniref:1-deoxy-D-xylulose-5-phosphate synthase n=1 Tax=Actinomarinicola tropica TaxID=2789776 RepID=A0A5Q2RNE9_9ACTN|nr:1-deoxy-D-xylulose-5-phosphate synthase [Actinomarinicola tropica]QGG96111.1 1-deoxy-D-xylulose-5-phosphate synthase [Actinomarinicola tropica]